MKQWLLSTNHILQAVQQHRKPAFAVKVAFLELPVSTLEKTSYIGLANHRIFVDGDYTPEDKRAWQEQIPRGLIFVDEYREYPALKKRLFSKQAAEQNPIYWNQRRNQFVMASPLTTLLELSGFLPSALTYQAPIFASPLASILIGGLMGAGSGHLLSRLIVGEPDTKAKKIARKLLIYGLATGLAAPGILGTIFNIKEHGPMGILQPGPIHTDVFATNRPPKVTPEKIEEMKEDKEKQDFFNNWERYVGKQAEAFPTEQATHKLKRALLSPNDTIKQAAKTVTTFLKGCVSCYYLNNTKDESLNGLKTLHIKMASGAFAQAVHPANYGPGYYLGDAICQWAKHGTSADLPLIAENICQILFAPINRD